MKPVDADTLQRWHQMATRGGDRVRLEEELFEAYLDALRAELGTDTEKPPPLEEPVLGE